VTNTSPIMAKTVQLWKIFGNTNHKIGNVHVEATIHVKIIFQFLILSCLKKSLQRKNKTIVSKIIVISSDLRKDKKYMNYCMNKILLIIYCDYKHFFNMNFWKDDFTTTPSSRFHREANIFLPNGEGDRLRWWGLSASLPPQPRSTAGQLSKGSNFLPW